jgi:hypothetical protein
MLVQRLNFTLVMLRPRRHPQQHMVTALTDLLVHQITFLFASKAC